MSDNTLEAILATAKRFIEKTFPWIDRQAVWVDPNNKRTYYCFTGKRPDEQTEFCIRAYNDDPFRCLGLDIVAPPNVTWDVCLVRPVWHLSPGSSEQPYWVLPSGPALMARGRSVEEVLVRSTIPSALKAVFEFFQKECGLFAWQDAINSWILPITLSEPVQVLRVTYWGDTGEARKFSSNYSWRAFLRDGAPDIYFFRHEGVEHLSPVIDFIKGIRRSFSTMNDGDDDVEPMNIDSHTGMEMALPPRIFIREHNDDDYEIVEATEEEIQSRPVIKSKRRNVTPTPANSFDNRHVSPLRDMITDDKDASNDEMFID